MVGLMQATAEEAGLVGHSGAVDQQIKGAVGFPGPGDSNANVDRLG